jgi:hypothetical protein
MLRITSACTKLTMSCLLHALGAPVPSKSHLLRFVCKQPNRCLTGDDLYRCTQEIRRFRDTNNHIEESFGHLSGSTPVGTADIEVVHRAFNELVEKLLFNLVAPVPFQEGHITPAKTTTSAPAPVPVPVSDSDPEVLGLVIPGVQRDSFTDKSLEAIINSMETMPTDRDITKLVFYWTTLDEYYGFKRAEVMQFD